ncbi:hypothetical protein [Kutzneria sp. NPDC051319]|uniref:hypothetical protein n=1 Tax=Kutzneria sp. NPDC051319 TaxID=3155047 RepID=UPI003427448F
MAEPETLAPGDLAEGHPQRQFESTARMRSAAPFSELVDFSLALCLDDAVAQREDPASETLSFDVRTAVLLALALYQAGLDQHATAEGTARAEFQARSVDMVPAAAALADPDRARALLALRPGHPRYADGQLRRDCDLADAPDLHGGHGEQWDQLRQSARDVLERAISRWGISEPNRALLTYLLVRVNAWNAFGWYDRPEFPQLNQPAN